MVNPEKIRAKISVIEENLGKLDELRQLPADEFKKDFRNIEAAKHLLQVSIEAMTDIGTHIISRMRLKIPATNADVFRTLSENGYIPGNHLDKFILMTRFRNKIVHFYVKVTPDEIYNILQEDLPDFKLFISDVLKKNLL
ncbi:MAG: DUF86 domain-containing protein [Candidatus Schekmanbacteria bacterium]|nr:DUF86 domain-containing protein [Candidatus Schekmanbacteria bacterium]